MVVLGFLLVAAAILIGLGVGISSSSSASIEGFGMEVETTAAFVFFAGVVTAVGALAGLWLMKKGTARTYRRRKEVKTLRQQVSEPVASEPGVSAAASPPARHSADVDESASAKEVSGDGPSGDGPSGDGLSGDGLSGGRPATTR